MICFLAFKHLRIQPHPYHGPPTAAAFLIPPAQLPSIFVSLAFQPLRFPAGFNPHAYTPLAASGQNPRHGTHPLRDVPGLPIPIARWDLASVPHAGLAPTLTLCVALICLLRTGQQLCGIYIRLIRHDGFPQPDCGLKQGGKL